MESPEAELLSAIKKDGRLSYDISQPFWFCSVLKRWQSICRRGRSCDICWRFVSILLDMFTDEVTRTSGNIQHGISFWKTSMYIVYRGYVRHKYCVYLNSTRARGGQNDNNVCPELRNLTSTKLDRAVMEGKLNVYSPHFKLHLYEVCPFVSKSEIYYL